jgi:DNA-directed RNA polymerase subunit beta'
MNVDITKKKLEKILHDILYSKKPNMGTFGVVSALNKLKNLSFKVSTYSGMSISMTDFDTVLKKKEELVAEAENKFKNADPGKLPSGYIDAQDALEAAKVEYVKNKLSSMLDDKNPDLLDPDSDMRIMQVSGARAKASQIVAMGGVFGVGKSVTEEKTRAIMNSHVEGLTPFQFWDSAYDSRKGIFDKSIATRDPGALTRKMWMANKQTIIVEKDCGDTKGIYLNMKSDYDKRALHGRVLLSPVVLKKPSNITISVTKEPLTKSQTDLIKTNGVIDDRVHVRSPLSCKSTQGICQLCYGARAGDSLDEVVPIGEAIGSIAAQSVGEPSQQAIMRTFHVGAGNASANSFQEIQRVQV